MKCDEFRPATTYSSRLCVDCGHMRDEHPVAYRRESLAPASDNEFEVFKGIKFYKDDDIQ